MPKYDYIYGSKVTIQCQAQINIEPWKGQTNYVSYLSLIKKDINFFKYWCKLRHAVTCTVDAPPDEELDEDIRDHVGTHKNAYLQERNRVVTWSAQIDQEEPTVPSKRGHRKQLLYIPHETFCAKDQGIKFILPNYTASGQNK